MEESDERSVLMALAARVQMQIVENVQIAIGDDHVDLIDLFAVRLQPDQVRARIGQSRRRQVRRMPDAVPAQMEVTTSAAHTIHRTSSARTGVTVAGSGSAR